MIMSINTGWLSVRRVFFYKTLSSRGVYIRPLVMVAPSFIPECIKPKCLAHGNEGEATPTTTIGILLLSYMMDTLPHWFFDHRGWSLLLLPLVPNKGLTQGEEGETTPMTIVGFLPLSYMVQTFSLTYFLIVMYGASTDLKSTQNVV